MSPPGVSNLKMKRVLEAMRDDELIPLPRLAEKLEMHEPYLRRILQAMAELGLVIQQPLPPHNYHQGRRPVVKCCCMGWKKTKIIKS
jgi:DNA-binding IclR family transcriptional regulator